MTKMRLLIKRPGRANTYIPVTVESADIIGNCIAVLVDHLGMPRRDGLGRSLTYTLRPLSADQPLPSTMRFADVQLLPETRLVLELEGEHVGTRPVDASSSGGNSAHMSVAEALMKPSRRLVRRRTVVVSSILAGCAVSGLFTGIATAFATGQHTHPIAKAPSARSSLHMPEMLQQTQLFSGHQQTVRAVSWSPDGTTVASGADDGFLLLWTPNGQVQQQISHPDSVTALAWSPTGQQLVSGSGKSVRFFDGHTATLLAPARRVHTAQVTSLAWSDTVGQPVISCSLDKRAIVWETQN